MREFFLRARVRIRAWNVNRVLMSSRNKRFMVFSVDTAADGREEMIYGCREIASVCCENDEDRAVEVTHVRSTRHGH